MNQNNYDLGTNKKSSKIIGERTSNFLNGLGAYFALVITYILFFVLIGPIFDPNIFEIYNLLPYVVISLLYLVFYSIITTRTVNAPISYKLLQIIKRLFDVVIGGLVLFFLSPLLLLLGGVLIIESPGPIFYRQQRVGQFGKPFDMYFFRTMPFAPTEKSITRAGKFLRRFHLTNMPALYNVLSGEMSMVGPSPRYPHKLKETLDPEGKILTVKPGITGLRKASMPSDLINSDLQYIENWSLVLDFKILFDKIKNVFQ
jgi:putative colanic acid biosynthesis UDP-glucose lipid carrier transferase